jgi:hypothetical protein
MMMLLLLVWYGGVCWRPGGLDVRCFAQMRVDEATEMVVGGWRGFDSGCVRSRLFVRGGRMVHEEEQQQQAYIQSLLLLFLL